MKSRMSTEYTDPNRAIPCTDTELPARTKLHNDNELPKCKKSSTDIEEPKRPKLRTDNELPKCKKSNTDKPEPKRPKLRKDNMSCTKQPNHRSCFI